jgi:hypothetical protein
MVEVFKARQEFYQHLTLLNAGTLSLLLTVVLALAATDHLSAVRVHDTRPFLRGRGMLVASILLSLIHNHLNVSFFINFGASGLNKAVGADLENLHVKFRRSGADPQDPEGPTKLLAVGNRAGRAAAVIENMMRVVGPLAQILTWVAYFEFVSSIHAIILAAAK